MQTNYIEEKKESQLALSIQMYDETDTIDMPISTLCKLAETRIIALKRIQNFFDRRKDNENRERKFYDELAQVISEIEIRHHLLTDPMYDRASHWFCKMAFAQGDLDGNFFPFYEKILFAGRLWANATKRVAAAEKNSKNVKPIMIDNPTATKENQTEIDGPSEDFEDARNLIFFEDLCKYMGIDVKNCKTTVKDKKVTHPDKTIGFVDHKMPFVMVPFRFALKAMECYDAELSKGRAQVTPYTAFMVVQDLFEEALKIHKKCVLLSLNTLLEADRRFADSLTALIKFKENLDLTNEIYYQKNQKFEQMEAEMVPQLAPYFPLCMLEIHDFLRKNHTLKHMGRLQFMSFLKAMGLDVKQAIRLFTRELNLTEKGRKQVKEYTYLIEHLYGLQGKKTDYTAWSCQKIIGKAIPQGNEVYGCPFKYYSDTAMKTLLKDKKNLNEDQITEVLGTRKVEPHQGCRKLFEITHPGVEVRKGIGKHPNAYFDASYHYMEKMNPSSAFLPK